MTFSEAISVCLSKYTEFSGRARRSEYWYFILFQIIISLIFDILTGIVTGGRSGSSIQLVNFIIWLVFLLPNLAVTVRRLHDISKSGWWIFISFVPLIGGIWLLILNATDSTEGSNEYGPSPK